jgi:Family of unknown function (DUF6152)
VRTRLFAAATAAMLAAAAGVSAHHSFAPFNTETEKTITGTVNRFEWTNPHTWLWIDVTEEKGLVTWGVEGMSPNYLQRRGWSRTTFKPGEKVTVVIRPMRDGSPGGMFVRATLADGKQLTFGAGPAN